MLALRAVPRAVRLLVLLAGLPIAIIAVDVARHAQNVPFWDEWHDPLAAFGEAARP